MNKDIKNLLAAVINSVKGNTAKSITYVFSFRVIGYVLTMIYGIIIARSLGPENRGIIAAIFSIPIIVSSFSHLGLPISNVYYICQGRDKEALFINSLHFIFVISCVCILSAFLMMPILGKTYFSGISHVYLAYLAISAMPMLLLRHFLGNFLRALGKFKELSYSSIIQEVSRLSLVVVAINLFHLSVDIVIIAVLVSISLNNVYLYWLIRKEIPTRPKKASFTQFKESLWYGLREYLGNLLANLNLQVDMVILAAFMDKKLLGIYAVAVGISSLFQFFPGAISTVLLPKLSGASGDRIHRIIRKSIILNGVFILISYFSFLAIGKWLIPFLYGNKFVDSFRFAAIILLGTFCLSICLIINKYFSGIGKPEIKSKIRAINLPIKAAAMYFLIKTYGLTGAAWSFVITASTLLIITLYYYFNEKKLNSLDACDQYETTVS